MRGALPIKCRIKRMERGQVALATLAERLDCPLQQQVVIQAWLVFWITAKTAYDGL
jgi:hypothetical protein